MAGNEYKCVPQMSLNTSFSKPFYIKVLVLEKFNKQTELYHQINYFTDPNYFSKQIFFKIYLSEN